MSSSPFDISDFIREWEIDAKQILKDHDFNVDTSKQEMMQTQSDDVPIASKLRNDVLLSDGLLKFYECTNGLWLWSEDGSLRQRIYEIDKIDLYKKVAPEQVEAWYPASEIGTRTVPSVPDIDYFIYGDDQDPLDVRLEYLNEAMLLSNDYLDAEILVIPSVVSEKGEFEIWYLAHYISGASRFRDIFDYLTYERKQNLERLEEYIPIVKAMK